MTPGVLDTLVIGAGPAGLASSRALSRRGIRHLVLERGRHAGQAWSDLYDSLVLHTARALSALPGRGFPQGTPLFPTRRDFVDYLQDYAAAFSVPIQTNSEALDVRRDNRLWRACLASGDEIAARSIVVATGILSNPQAPQLPGRDQFNGLVMHSVEYRRPQPFAGQRVLVIGTGNSGADIALELADAGVDVAITGRRGAAMMPLMPLTVAGIPVHYFGFALAPLLAWQTCPRTAIVGRRLHAALRTGAIRWRDQLVELNATAARFRSGAALPVDSVICATGYRPAVGFLGDLIAFDECGFPERRGRVASADQPDLYFVGHRYDSRGALYNIGRDASLAADLVRSALSEPRQTRTEMPQPHYGK